MYYYIKQFDATSEVNLLQMVMGELWKSFQQISLC